MQSIHLRYQHPNPSRQQKIHLLYLLSNSDTPANKSIPISKTYLQSLTLFAPKSKSQTQKDDAIKRQKKGIREHELMVW
jgi:hypothetical protein